MICSVLHRPVSVYLLSDDRLCVEYAADLSESRGNISKLGTVLCNAGAPIDFIEEKSNPIAFVEKYCYFSRGEDIVFALPEKFVNSWPQQRDFFLACPMSDWGNASQCDRWKLRRISVDGRNVFGLPIGKSELPDSFQFKFISSDGEWYSPAEESSNCRLSPMGTVNFFFDPKITGNNVLTYHLRSKVLLQDKLTAKFSDNSTVAVNFDRWIAAIYGTARLGTEVFPKSTTFSVFAPRATSARVVILSNGDGPPSCYQMERASSLSGVWRVEIRQKLDGYRYCYQFLFNGDCRWGDAPLVPDPYARVQCSSSGPSLIMSEKAFGRARSKFVTPKSKDLIIVEAHLRDLLAKTRTLPFRRQKFNGLRRNIKDCACYLRSLGINCVELQPMQEFEYGNRKEYQWGYMPVNWFAPASYYASNPKRGSQVEEFRRMVSAFHNAGIAVVLDVVYNHCGHSCPLKGIDGGYYFRRTKSGELSNCSGCGNDFRVESPMAGRMVIDSLVHMLTVYNVDGFRFDLAELLGMDFLATVQRELRCVKDSVILIAEPWSFRGNIGVPMRHLSYSVWNDEYRDFVKSYVLGGGNGEGLRYFLCGCMDFRSKFPSQSVNYLASHDDLCWIDSITENADHNGSLPTANDRKRTRLAAAILFLSIGVPMMAAGQDFLFSKHGASNTYNRGDLNVLNYKLLKKNRHTHEYFRKLIELRQSKFGVILRLDAVPSRTYFRFFTSPDSSACAMVYNADGTFKMPKLIFAINPHDFAAVIDFKEFDISRSKTLADGDKFFTFRCGFHEKFSYGKLTLPPLSCRIFQLCGS